MPSTASCSSIEPYGITSSSKLTPNTQVETVGQGMKKCEATYLFGVSFSSVKRYARKLSSMVNSGQAQPTCTDDDCCASLPGRSPLHSNNLPMARPSQRIAETA
jgi:hypothetical protein